MGEYSNTGHISVFEKTVRHGAEAWDRLDRDEVDARRARTARRKSEGWRRNSRSGPVRTEVRVRPEVMRAALKAAGGDVSRLRIVSDTEVWVD
ncbi:hypothetical protein [Streptomyces sp. BH105]|uniref:hypothetical protein n=1 Tax=Streptomyces sp. BH105 TaxID=3410408 RepID=UPI003CF879D3